MAHIKDLGIFKNKRDSAFGFFYLMTVGVLLAWVMVAGIIDTTVFQRDHIVGLIRMFFIVGIFGLFFLHKYLTRIGIVILTIVAIFIASGFFYTPDEPNIANRFAELITSSIQFITGYRPHHTMAYERFIVWTISLFFGFFVVFFSYRKFRFWVLFVVSVATISLTITSAYFRSTQIFYTYAFCVLALAIKYLHEKNVSKMVKPPKRTLFIKIAVPLVAGVVLLASTIPRPPTVFAGGSVRDMLRAPFDFINDMFLNITQPSEFSLRQIGFGESGGRLGGDIVANDRVFMRINTNSSMPLYLTGATRDTYTGYSWENLNYYYQPVDFDAFAHTIEFAERLLSSEHFSWLYPQIEVVASGRLVQVDVDELYDYFWSNDPYLRIFIDELTDRWIWATANQSADGDWYIDFINFDFFYVPDGSRGRIEINNLDRRLSTIFHSGIVETIEVRDEDLSFLRTRDGRFLSEQRLSSNTVYEIQYFHVMPNWAGVPRELENSYRGILQNISNLFTTFQQNYEYRMQSATFSVDGAMVSHEDFLNYYLIPRADRIYEIYTVLPADFPERVRALALEVTADAPNDYRKMRALEHFLRSTFDYTLTPGSSPIDQDFVDHFLFDLQRGYCVHFATAFVTMARSLGLPSRYVEGFYVDIPNDMIGEDMYVLNRMAHAWPEVYFEGYGWQRFEPTPASGLHQQEEADSPSDVGVWPDAEYWFSDWDIPYFNGNSSFNQNAGGGQQLGSAFENLEYPAWIWIGLVMVLAAVLILVRVAFVLWRNSRVRKKENNEVAIYRFKVLLSYLDFLGFGIKETETAIQFTGRIENSFSNLDFEKELLKSASAVFAKARYSKQEISDIECSVLEKLIQRMDNRMQLELGKGQYFVYRYVLAKV